MPSDRMNARRARSKLEAEADVLVGSALSRLERIYEDQGGAGWLDEEPRYHFWKAMDEFFSANHHSKEGDLNQMDERVQDGLNHIFMATYLAHELPHLEGGDDGPG